MDVIRVVREAILQRKMSGFELMHFGLWKISQISGSGSSALLVCP